MRLGSHLSVAGGVANAVRSAMELELECVQVFTANQRQWSPKAPSRDEIVEWFEALRAASWNDPDDHRTVSHNSYLVNMASPDAEARERSIAAQRAELERCEALAIRRCVMHPGAHLGVPAPRLKASERPEPCTDDELAGLKRLAASLDLLHAQTKGFRVVTCLENTAGAGSALGYDLRQLAMVRDRVRHPERVGYCFDTCHATAAGYDMSTEAGASATLGLIRSVLGADRVLVFHLNDSKGACGSRLDRHEHIGDGLCGAPCFRSLLAAGEFARCPGILETPKEGSFKGRPWDAENIRRLRALASTSAPRRSPTARTAARTAGSGSARTRTRPGR